MDCAQELPHSQPLSDFKQDSEPVIDWARGVYSTVRHVVAMFLCIDWYLCDLVQNDTDYALNWLLGTSSGKPSWDLRSKMMGRVDEDC